MGIAHGTYPRHNVKEGTKAYRWCFNNGIQVGVTPDLDTSNDWIIEIRINGKKSFDPIKYPKDEVMNKVYKYCEYYYKKYKKDEE